LSEERERKIEEDILPFGIVDDGQSPTDDNPTIL